jgi:hypothetical protein
MGLPLPGFPALPDLFALAGRTAKLITMPDTKTERDSCRFALQFAGGKPQIIVQTFHGTISLLKGNAVLGFNLLAGITQEQAKKVADALNEHVLDLFVSEMEVS